MTQPKKRLQLFIVADIKNLAEDYILVINITALKLL